MGDERGGSFYTKTTLLSNYEQVWIGDTCSHWPENIIVVGRVKYVGDDHFSCGGTSRTPIEPFSIVGEQINGVMIQRWHVGEEDRLEILAGKDVYDGLDAERKEGWVLVPNDES